MAAWVLARHLLPPTVSTFAPFTALIALQATVYRSVRDSAQYLLAMAAGAALAATLAAVAGINGWTFGLLTLIALGVGRIRRFGQQGTQVAIVGFFAFSACQGKIDYIGHLAASVVLGALCGLAAHLVLAPARHVHHHRQAVADLHDGIGRRLNGLVDIVEGKDHDIEHIRQCRRDWHTLSAECERIRRGIDAEIENNRLHPRRGIDSAYFALLRARDAVAVAERMMDHLRSMTRALEYALDSGEIDNLSGSFRAGFGSLLQSESAAMREIGQTSPADPGRLANLIDTASAQLSRVEQQEQPNAETSAGTHAAGHAPHRREPPPCRTRRRPPNPPPELMATTAPVVRDAACPSRAGWHVLDRSMRLGPPEPAVDRIDQWPRLSLLVQCGGSCSEPVGGNMRVGVYLAHPRSGSFNHAVFDAVVKELRERGVVVLAHDLYAEGFAPLLSAPETDTVESAPPAPDARVELHREEVATMDAMVFIHPNWWGMPPAILAGWVQRVLVPGVAYKLGTAEGEPAGLLRAGKALVLNTSDTPADRETGEFGDPLQSIWAACVLPYVGVGEVRRTVFRTVSDSTDRERESWLAQARREAAALLG
ncbi:NAD(P)H-dependent oxidoreductase [Streptomyces sp. NPDC051000]|uniref:NAD(P)H-dependent oxidoreductase n=1 Tax=Streptomyces sp. NPDC051000 TaxID=3155520 RepID=UPI00340CAFC1